MPNILNLDELKALFTDDVLLSLKEHGFIKFNTKKELRPTNRFHSLFEPEQANDETEFFEELYLLYPNQTVNGERIYHTNTKADKAEAFKKFEWFRKNYDEFSPDIIRSAVNLYVAECRRNNYFAMRMFKYFFHKIEVRDNTQYVVSELHKWCESIQKERGEGWQQARIH